jgi:acetyl-CoA acetyltransferase
VSRLPVIIGVGQSVHRDEGAEMRALILDAARAAGDDSGSQALDAVSAVEMMRVGSWRDDDVPARVADALGLSVARARMRTSPTGGESPLRALDAVATRIAAGESGVTLIAGAEANGPGAVGARRARGSRPPGGGRVPREFDGMRRAFQVGIARALDFFPLYENATRHCNARSIRCVF